MSDPNKPPHSTFLGVDYVPAKAEALRASGARAAFLGVPYDMSAIYRSGTAAGPHGLRDASRQYGPYFFDDDVDFCSEFKLVDCGDVAMIPAAPDRCRDHTRTSVAELLAGGVLPICIGGDHSIPIPLGQAIDAHATGKVGYIVFDANMDAEPEVEGEMNSNWSEFCRLCELPNFDPTKMVLIGIRGSLNTRRQMEYIRDKGARLISMREVMERGIVSVMEEALAIAGTGTEHIYVSFDTDGVDAAYAPGTSGPEPGGLTSREILTAARMIGAHGVSLVDIVEYCPAYDPSGITGKLCCYIIFNLLGARHAAERAGTITA